MSRLLRALQRHSFRAITSTLIVLFFLAHATGLYEWGYIHNLELRTYDARLNFTRPNTADSRVVIVDIDEKSLAELGRWPWNRELLARIIDALFDHYQINLLGFDVVFAEPDVSSGLSTLEKLALQQLKHEPAFLETLQGLRQTLDYDQRFANSLKNRRIVLGYAMISGAEGDAQASISGQLPAPTLDLAEMQDYRIYPTQAVGYVGNLPAFTQATITSGHFNSLPDNDGITRRVPLLYGYQDKLYESLALAMTRVFLGEPFITTQVEKNGNYLAVEALGLGTHRAPVDARLHSLIPFRGARGSFTYVSAVDVLKHQVDPETLRGAIVLLGTTAQGLFDLRATPVDEVYPGVEIHANIISGILDQRMLGSPPFVIGAEMLLVLLAGISMILLMLRLNPLWATTVALLLTGMVVTINLLFWTRLHTIIPLAATLLTIWTLFLFNMAYGYFVEARNKRQLTHLFGQYVPPQLVDEMSNNPGAKFSMEGDSREMTVLFSDVRGFTTISEGLNPKELSQLMNTFLTPMTHIIHEHRGTIDKYMGDAIMAFWGAPLADPQHARHALQAALAMTQTLEDMQPEFRARHWPEIRIGVGLNTGIMNVGNMGSEFRMAYTVLGDAVNLGSRLEGLTKQYGVTLIVSESTRQAVPDYLYRELDRVRVKGKELPVVIYQPLGLPEQLSPDLIEEVALYHQALDAYRQQHWDTASEQLSALAARDPEQAPAVYGIYLARISHFRTDAPGPEWDGVFTHTSK